MTELGVRVREVSSAHLVSEVKHGVRHHGDAVVGPRDVLEVSKLTRLATLGVGHRHSPREEVHYLPLRLIVPRR